MLYTTTKNLFRLKLLLIGGTIMIVIIVLFDIISNNSNRLGSLGRKESKYYKAQQAELLRVDELLHARLWQIQTMDQQFINYLTTQNDASALEKTHASIQYSEEIFRKLIDSIERIGTKYDEASGTNDFQNLNEFFKKILENRRFLSYTRQGVLSDSKGPGSDKQTILRLQNELFERDKIIADYARNDSAAESKTLLAVRNDLSEKDKQLIALQAQIQKAEADKELYVQSTQKLQADLAEKEKLVADLSSKKGTDQTVVQNLQKDITAKNNQISTLQGQIQKEQADKNGYAQTIQKLQLDLNEKNKQLAAANKKAPTDQRALNNQITALQTQIQKEQAEKNTHIQTIQKLQGDLNDKNKQLTALLNKKSPTDQRALTSLQNDVNEKNKKIQALESQIRKEQTDRKKITDMVSSLQLELIEKNKQLVAGNKRTPTDQKTVTALQNEIAEKDKRIRNLQGQLAVAQRGQANVAGPVASGENLKELQDRNTNLRLAYNNTMAQLGSLQKRYNEMKSELDLLKNQRR